MAALDDSKPISSHQNQNLGNDSQATSINPIISSKSILKLIDQLPSMVGYYDKNLKNKYVNKAYESWFGCKLSDIAGKHISEIIGEQLYTYNLPYLEGVLSGKPQVFERAIPLSDGVGFRYSLAHYIPDFKNNEVQGFYAVVTDVSQLKKVEIELCKKQEALELSESRYRLVVEAQTELISRLKADGTYIFVNGAFCRFFGMTQEQLIGFKWMPNVFPDDQNRVTEELSTLSASNPVIKIEYRVIASNGSVHWMQFINTGIFNGNDTFIEVQCVGREITDQKLAENKIKALALTDSLTGLANRRWFLHHLKHAISLSWRNAKQGALLFIDLDHFKLINDTHGHDIGDLVLIEMANRIKYCLRPEDTLARVGGDEFVLILENLSLDPEETLTIVTNIANKICEAVSRPYEVNDTTIYSTISIGVSLFSKESDTPTEQIKHADMALYQAKTQGRNRIIFFETQK